MNDFIYKCNHCGKLYEEPEYVDQSQSDEAKCPFCGDDNEYARRIFDDEEEFAEFYTTTIELPIKAKPKERPRFGKGYVYTPKKTSQEEWYIGSQYTANGGIYFEEEPVAMELIFVYAIPKSWTKKKREAAQKGKVYKTSVPDLDNIEKLVADALHGRAYKNDSQIIDVHTRKEYGEEDKIIITVKRGDLI